MRLLLVEDDEIEVLKFERIVASRGKYFITKARDGLEAWELLGTMRELPELILLDIKMPRMDGITFLGKIKAEPHLRHIPCVVLTTSKNPTDVHECFQAGICGYLVKPLKLEAYKDLITKLLDYWEANHLWHGKNLS